MSLPSEEEEEESQVATREEFVTREEFSALRADVALLVEMERAREVGKYKQLEPPIGERPPKAQRSAARAYPGQPEVVEDVSD